MSVAVSLLRRGCWTEAHRLGPKRPLVDHVRDLLEAELKLIASPSKLYTSAAEWRAWHQLFALPPAAAARWPFYFVRGICWCPALRAKKSSMQTTKGDHLPAWSWSVLLNWGTEGFSPASSAGTCCENGVTTGGGCA